MKTPSATSAALVAAVLTTLTNAHSWVEEAYRIAPNGTLVGAPGYPRGWIARTSTDPLWKDAIPQWLLPLAGQSAYSGDEKLNKYDFVADPKFAMLQAAPGDHVALIHLENGHTTLPQNQPKKPRNRGTLFFYGTADPKPQERLFDVHLVWNRDGTGGDKRGRLLATRNYDDGQCYQPNPGEISNERAKQLAADGAVHDRELRCQSDIQLPADLKPGSTYTVYWYWDWPDLNADQINMDATKDGKYPWAGTFMRGEKDPHGFTMAAIARNESYASTVDIKIVEAAQLPGGAVAKLAVGVDAMAAWNSQQNIYTKAIKAQMTNNYQVDIDANQPAGGGGGGSNAPSATATATATATPPASGLPSSGAGGPPSAPPSSGAAPTGVPGSGVTVTVTVTVPPSTVVQTVYFPKSTADGTAPSQPAAPPASSNSMPQPAPPASSASQSAPPANTNSVPQPSQPAAPPASSNSMPQPAPPASSAFQSAPPANTNSVPQPSQPSQPAAPPANTNSTPQPSEPSQPAAPPANTNSVPQPTQPDAYATATLAGSAPAGSTTFVTKAFVITHYDRAAAGPTSSSSNSSSSTVQPVYALRGRQNWHFGQ